jgi:4-amino-4-deoxy-L-arabinose transferase-like glycosyltransferase
VSLWVDALRAGPRDAFAPVRSQATRAERAAVVLLLIVAWALRVYGMALVPPGIHDDEVINAQLADALRVGGGWSVFYPVGEGREGLYYPLLVASRILVGRAPWWYRMPAAGLSLLTAALVYRLARRWGGPWVALPALGGLAVTFWPLHLGRVALRAVTLPPLGAGLVLALWRALERPRWGRRALGWYAVAGLLLGLSQYTYLAARALPLGVLLFAAYLACCHPSRLRAHWRGWAAMLALAALVALPLGLYLARHWGEQERLARAGEPLEALWRGDPGPTLRTAGAVLGMFVWRGDPQPHYNLPGRPVFGLVGGALFVVGVVVAAVHPRRPASAFCLLWSAATLLPTALSQPAPHWVRACGALVTAFVFPGLAVAELAPVLNRRGRFALALGLAGLLVLEGALSARDYFGRWARLSEVRAFHHAGLAEVARYLDGSPDTAPMAACTPFLNETHYFWRSDRQALPYLLNRRDIAVGWYDCQQAALFLQGGGAGRYLFADGSDFAAFVPSDWRASARPIARFTDDRLVEVANPQALAAWLAALERPAGLAPTWGGVMALEGYRLQPPAPAPGDEVTLLTAWRVLGSALPYDLAVFVHLVAPDGSLAAQGDALGALSDTLRAGDVFVQRHTLALPRSLPGGEYRLLAGLYVRGGARLALDGSAGDAVTLATLTLR